MDTDNKATQIGMILRHMEQHGSITAAEAMEDYGIARLASRINDMRKRGYAITSIIEYGVNRFGRETRYARYYMEERA